MEWTLESGQTVVWQWSQAPATAPLETAGERYAIRIHIGPYATNLGRRGRMLVT